MYHLSQGSRFQLTEDSLPLTYALLQLAVPLANSGL